MEILLNGKPHQIESGCNLIVLVEQLALTNKRIAVEVNQEIVPRSQFGQHCLVAGDRVEIVQAIGGG